MTALFINLDGLIWVFAGFGAFFLCLLLAAIRGVLWLGRPGWRRWAGVGIIAAILGYGLLPTTIDNIRGNRLGAQMEAASFWPEQIEFAGTTVVMVTHQWPSCDPLCEALFERGNVGAIYLVGVMDEGLSAREIRVALGNPSSRVERIVLVTSDRGVRRMTSEPASLPDTAEWLVVRDAQGSHALSNAAEIDLPPGAFDQIAGALHIYALEGARPDAAEQPAAVARMLTGWRTERPYFLPMAASSSFSNDTTAFSEALETWICGPITQEWDRRCPYLF